MSLRIVFMGTPGFAVYSLAALIDSPHKICAVVTSTDKPAGRGKKVRESEVKKFASQKGLKLLQPINLKDTSFKEELISLKADVFVVVAFRMLPKTVWSIPAKGTFNLHASLLPNYRGAAPINWAIINQEKSSGVTTFLINEKIDTGKILRAKEVQLSPEETAESLHDKLAPLGAKLVLETLKAIEQGIKALEQVTKGNEKEAPKLTKNNTRINWEKKPQEIDAFIRGLSPYPAAWSECKTNQDIFPFKIYKATLEQANHNLNPGYMLIENKQLKIALQSGFLICELIQIPNKKRMKPKDLLNGFSFSKGSTLS